jgi:hypothetical protein
MRRLGLALVLTWAASSASADMIRKACLTSNRSSGDFTLCNCIQDAANLTLSTKDQRLAASFFKDPDKAQEVRQSDRRTHETFWERYKSFGEMAETFCQK